ncbi:WD repeat domain-containing protein 83 isoform X1 [Bemisia tabaci]|uniref:WD repeat domain-containing protein 83 isoform X1 n=1 Tax=Bemisia tabaci TaxID=7038 RepID=UPI003B27B714
MFSWNEVLLEFLNSFWPGISAEGFLLVFQFFDQFRSNACSHHTLEDLKSGHDAPISHDTDIHRYGHLSTHCRGCHPLGKGRLFAYLVNVGSSLSLNAGLLPNRSWLWRLKMDYSLLQKIDCKQGAIRAVRFNVDGEYCLTCGSDKKIKLWNPHRGVHLKTYSGHGNDVLDVCGSCDSDRIISAGADKSVILWDVATGQPIRRFRGHTGRVHCVSFNEESTMACSGSLDNSVILWDIKSNRYDPVQVLKEAKDCITKVVVTDHEIITASLDCRIRRYDIRMCQIFCDFVGEPITSATLTRDSQCYLISCTDSVIRLLEKDSGELLSEYQGHSTKDFSIESCLDQSDTYVLSGSTDGNVYCWDLVSSAVKTKYNHGQSLVVSSIICHPTKSQFLSAAGQTISLWGEKGSEDSGD